jgi:hypothetical protein
VSDPRLPAAGARARGVGATRTGVRELDCEEQKPSGGAPHPHPAGRAQQVGRRGQGDAAARGALARPRARVAECAPGACACVRACGTEAAPGG